MSKSPEGDRVVPSRAGRGHLAAVLALLALVLASSARADDVAAIRFVHLSADTPLVDVVVGGRLTFRDVAFMERSHVATVSVGTHEVRVFPHRPPRRMDAAEEGIAATPPATPLEPVVMILRLTAGRLTTIVLSGAYEPPLEEEWRGHLSIQVDPPDAEILLEGPRGFQAVLQGDQFLVGLEPGPYRAEVRSPGYVPVEYEAEIAAGTTAIASITLQEADADAVAEPWVTPPLERQATWHGLELQPYEDETVPLAPPGAALVRFIHVAPTVPDLDIEGRHDDTDDAPEDEDDGEDQDDDGAADTDAGVTEATPFEVTGLSYPNASAYHLATLHPYLLEFRVAGTASLVHTVNALAFAPGATYTVFVSVNPVSNQIWLVPVVDALVAQHVPRVQEP